MHLWFLAASVLLGILGIIPYIRHVVNGQTKPNIAGWLTWTLLTAVATVAEMGAGEYITAIVTLSATLQTGLIVILGMKYGYASYHWTDRVCQIAALLGLGFWVIVKNADIAVLLMVAIDTLGAVPTMRHAWQSPNEETALAFAISALAGLASVGAVSSQTITGLSYPIYLTVINVMLATLILSRRTI